MRTSIVAALAALALTVPIAAASAQGLERPDRPWAVRLGAIWPTNKDVRDATSDAWFDAGLDYTLGRTEDGNDWVAALDFGTQSSINYWALQGLYMWRNPGMEGSGGSQFSYGLGIAAYILDADNGGSKSEFGIPLVAEWGLSRNVFLQGKFHWVASETRDDAVGLTVGYRF